MTENKNIFTWNLSEGNTNMWTSIRMGIYTDSLEGNFNSLLQHYKGLLDDIFPFLEEDEFQEIEDMIKAIDEDSSEDDYREIKRTLYKTMHNYKLYHSFMKFDETIAALER